jgi:hypothetical protein
MLESAQDDLNGAVFLSWSNAWAPPAQFLGFAWDIYEESWVLRGWNGTMWYPYAASATSGDLELGQSGSYHLWISNHYPDGSWYPCSNPWTGIMYSGKPHTPRDVSAQKVISRTVRLRWKPETHGVWHWQVIAFRAGQGWVPVRGPSGKQLWQFIVYPSSQFVDGSVDLIVPRAGTYWFYVRGVGWLPPYEAGEFGVAGITLTN